MIKYKVFVRGNLLEGRSVKGLGPALCNLNVTRGDFVRLHQREGSTNAEDYYNEEFEVLKVVKVLEKDWNRKYITAIEVYLR